MEQLSAVDTPIHRATVCMVSVVQLEKELDVIRERRLAMRLSVQKLAKVSGDKADLTSFLKFDKLLVKMQAEIAKLDTKAAVAEQGVNKLRALVIEMGE